MKGNILPYFIKEEIRLHMSLTNRKNYYTYPLMIIIFFASITIFAKKFFTVFNTQAIAVYTINILFVGGIMSGTFGLYARDFLERKFGDFGRLFQNSLIQPIALNKIFLTTALSDTFFYLLWFILPLMIGYTIGLFILGENILQALFLFISSFLSFLTGLMSAFALSVIYERSKVLFSSIFLIISSIFVYLFMNYNIGAISPFHIFYFNQTLISLILSIFLVVILSLIAYFSVGREYKTSVRKLESKNSFSFNKRFDTYLIKDFIDMKRTGDLFGKPFFNVFLPSVLVLLMFMRSKNFEILNLGTMFFAIIIGTLGTQMLNSLINSDSFAYYKHLPISLENFIKPKIKLSVIICFVESVIILFFYAYYINDFTNIIASLIITFALLIYNFNLSFYLTGLNPNENLMHTKTFLMYSLLLIPILILIVLINMLFNTTLFYVLIFLVMCYLLSKLYFKLGLKKWDIRL